MKAIKRQWMYDFDYKDTIQGEALFVATGQWADGRLAYSMLNADGNIDPKHEGSFVQVRHNNKLTMVRIQVEEMKEAKSIECYKFVSWDVQAPSHQTMEDYKRISTYSGYNVNEGVYKLLGYKYLYYQHLRLFWYRNYGQINQAYALNITDLKRVLRNHYKIGKDFKAVEVKRQGEDMKKFILSRVGDTYYLANKRTGKLLTVIGYVNNGDYEKALKYVDDKNKGII